MSRVLLAALLSRIETGPRSDWIRSAVLRTVSGLRDVRKGVALGTDGMA